MYQLLAQFSSFLLFSILTCLSASTNALPAGTTTSNAGAALMNCNTTAASKGAFQSEIWFFDNLKAISFKDATVVITAESTDTANSFISWETVSEVITNQLKAFKGSDPTTTYTIPAGTFAIGSGNVTTGASSVGNIDFLTSATVIPSLPGQDCRHVGSAKGVVFSLSSFSPN